MMEKILNQIFDKCINELKNEDNLSYVEKEIFIPIINRYNSKMQNTLIKIYTMYSAIVVLLLITIILLIILILKRFNYS
jgi:predicted neutral ceramidase superfamily lipid hydrolase